MYTPKKLPQEVSNALAASVQQLGMHGAVVVQSEPAAGLDYYAGSSEFNTPSMTDNTDDDRKALNLQDKLLLAKQAKLKQKQEKKPGLRGTSPVKEIGKTKKRQVKGSKQILSSLFACCNRRTTSLAHSIDQLLVGSRVMFWARTTRR